MPFLKAILVNATDKSNRMLRAKSMECISLVGMAVGKDKFRDDAKQVDSSFCIISSWTHLGPLRDSKVSVICCIMLVVRFCFFFGFLLKYHVRYDLFLVFTLWKVMEVLMSLQGSQMETDDPTTSYMLQVCSLQMTCRERNIISSYFSLLDNYFIFV